MLCTSCLFVNNPSAIMISFYIGGVSKSIAILTHITRLFIETDRNGKRLGEKHITST